MMNEGSRLTHLTLNTGRGSVTTRADVSSEGVARVRPLVLAQGGPIPGMPGLHFDLERKLGPDRVPLPGGAGFNITLDPAGTVVSAMCVACWDKSAEEELWSELAVTWERIRNPMESYGFWRPLPPIRPTLPWLVVVLAIEIGRVPMPMLPRLADFERTAFWALVELDQQQAQAA